MLRGSISPAEWARFDWYGRRVRKFTYTRDPDALDIAMHVYFRLAQLRATPLLSSLRHLHCPSMRQNDFLISGVFLFLSPSLQVLELENISNVEDKLCGTVLHTLHSDGASMQKVVLRGQGLSKDSLNLAISFDHLRGLELHGMGEALNMEILERIGSMASLVELSLDFTESSVPPLDRDIGFKDLKSFTITAPIPFIQTFLPYIGTTTLEAFNIEAPSNPPVDKKEFLTDVVTRWKDSLRRIELVHPCDTDVAEEIDVTVLAPLLPLRKLTHFRLEGYSLELQDQHITDFATAWPDIVTLMLPFIGSGRPRPTIESLRTVAQRCPRLRKLRLPLDTTDLVSFVSTGAPHSPPHELHTLFVASADDPWELRDLLHLGRHVDYFFPQLRWVYSYEGNDADRWIQLHETIQMYQTVRREAAVLERERIHQVAKQALSLGS